MSPLDPLDPVAFKATLEGIAAALPPDAMITLSCKDENYVKALCDLGAVRSAHVSNYNRVEPHTIEAAHLRIGEASFSAQFARKPTEKELERLENGYDVPSYRSAHLKIGASS